MCCWHCALNRFEDSKIEYERFNARKAHNFHKIQKKNKKETNVIKAHNGKTSKSVQRFKREYEGN